MPLFRGGVSKSLYSVCDDDDDDDDDYDGDGDGDADDKDGNPGHPGEVLASSRRLIVCPIWYQYRWFMLCCKKIQQPSGSYPTPSEGKRFSF